MANHFPTLPAGSHVAALSYYPVAQQVATASGSASCSLYTTTLVSVPIHGPQIFTVSFNTGSTNGVTTYDYSGFDQDAFETNLTTFLDAYCTYVAAVLGVTTTVVQQSMTVQRQWMVEMDAQADGLTLVGNVMDTMTYPPAS